MTEQFFSIEPIEHENIPTAMKIVNTLHHPIPSFPGRLVNHSEHDVINQQTNASD